MVTLVETKSESRTRRAGRLRGGVCGLAEKSVESAQSVDRHRVTESYPLGGNGVAVGTTNYPGAAAHTRLGGGTGFRRDEAVSWSRNAAPLNVYYDGNWQAIEVRTNGTAASNVASQTVWSAAYINAPVLQDTYLAGVLVPNSRLYFQQDANWDTTAVVGYNATTGTWGVVQRYVYSPYGNIIILNPSFTPATAGTVPMVQNLYQGMLQDPVTGLYYERNRNYSASLGAWVSQDPARYINGANTYQFVMGGPVDRVDPSGLSSRSILGVYPIVGPDGQWYLNFLVKTTYNNWYDVFWPGWFEMTIYTSHEVPLSGVERTQNHQKDWSEFIKAGGAVEIRVKVAGYASVIYGHNVSSTQITEWIGGAIGAAGAGSSEGAGSVPNAVGTAGSAGEGVCSLHDTDDGR